MLNGNKKIRPSQEIFCDDQNGALKLLRYRNSKTLPTD
jgi:hypothetical protein